MEINQYLNENQLYQRNKMCEEMPNDKSMLRFITCGSVDDGKSTLIGRLLFDTKMIFEDQLNQLLVDSKKMGTQGKNIDFALLVDGLSSEREQGITIDVAYRFFATTKRKFIVADTPGHEQYTRNMITGASTADLAVLLVDARKGILTQTRRHSYLCRLLGVRKVVLAVNKMDLVQYDKAVFEKIVNDFNYFSDVIGIDNFAAIPISGLIGDNITTVSKNMGWYSGPALLDYLDQVEPNLEDENNNSFYMPVQYVSRPSQDFRGFCGKITSGRVKPNDLIKISPSGKTTQVDRIVTFDGDVQFAAAGQSVTLTFKDEIDCSRGQVISEASSPPEIADQFEVTLIWMDDSEMVPGRPYLMKSGTQIITAALSEPKYKVNVNTLERMACSALELNDIGVCTLTTDRFIPFSSYEKDKTLGSFIVIDKSTNGTVGAGLINFSLRRSQNIHWHANHVDVHQRSSIKKQKPIVLWLTGLSGSGKSTIANEVERKLAQLNWHTFLLDGDNLRHGLNKDLGFKEADRVENLRRAGEVAKLMAEAGLIVITAFISPFSSERKMVRDIIDTCEFLEVFIDTPLAVAEQRDVKGLYKKARLGELKNFTGIDSPYEAPLEPDIHIQTTTMSVDQASDLIVDRILKSIVI